MAVSCQPRGSKLRTHIGVRRAHLKFARRTRAGTSIFTEMSPTRREALAQLAALAALPLVRWAPVAADPLDGTIADYQAGRRRGDWTAAEVTARALDRCQRGRTRDGARSTRSPTRRSTTPAPPTHGCAPDARVARSTASPSSPRRSTTSRAADHRVERGVGAALPRSGAARCARGRAPARGRRDRPRARPPPTTSRIAATARAATPDRCSIRTTARAHARPAGRAPARRSPSPAAWRSPRSAPTTAARIAFRRSSPASWG